MSSENNNEAANKAAEAAKKYGESVQKYGESVQKYSEDQMEEMAKKSKEKRIED
jgi:hypothetical protein